MMSDQFRQDPEEELPDWLKELRNRGSIEGEEQAPANEPNAAPIPENAPDEVSDADEFPGEAQESEIVDEITDEVDEPEWLQEIRLRHQQESAQDKEPPAAPENASEWLAEDHPKEDREDSSQWAAPEEQQVPAAPILEVPVEPPATIDQKSAELEESAEILASDEALGSIEAPDKSQTGDTPTDGFNDAFSQAFPESLTSEDAASTEELASIDVQDDPDQELPHPPEIPIKESSALGYTKSEEAAQELDSDSDTFEKSQLPSTSFDEEDSSEGVLQESEGSYLDEYDEKDDAEDALAQFLTEGSEPTSPAAINTDEVEELQTDEEPVDDASAEKDELLAWLSSEEKKQEAQGPVSAFSESVDSELAPAELPAWLAALKPDGEAADTVDENEDEHRSDYDFEDQEFAEDQERVGPLAGLSGIIPAEPEVVQLGRSKIPTGKLELSPHQQQHVANLQQVLANEGAPIREHSKRIALPMRIMQLLFAGILILATLFPLITGSQTASRAPLGSIPESTAFFNQIELLPPNIPVLVAFEVQPALYGEMKVVAAAILDHLLDKQARLVFISTQPTGPALVERLLAEELSQQPSIATNDYVNLGYLSGGTAALRYFASNPREATLLPQQWQSSSLESINTIANFGIVLTITGDAEDARAWVEQASPLTSDGLFSISSAQAAPLLLPYLESDPVTIRSLVAGLNGAAYYESLRNRDGLGREYWDAYSYGVGAIVILILLGSLYGRLIQMRPEQAKAKPDANK